MNPNQVKQFITSARGQGIPDDQTVKYLQSKGVDLGSSQPAQPTQSTPGLSDALGINKGGLTPEQVVSGAKEVAGAYGNSVSNQAKSGVDQATSGYQDMQNAVKGGFSGNNILKLLEGGVKTVAGAGSVLFSPLAPASDAIGAGVNAVANPISNIPAVQKFANSKAGDVTSRVATDVANTAGAVGTVAGAMEIPNVANTVKNVATKTADTIASGIDQIKVPSPVDTAKINDLYNRAIKPTVVGKSNEAQVQKANSQVVSGIKAIADNKANLKLVNPDGEVLSNATPKSVDQLNQAITQTKETIFKQYDALAKQAGDAGITVDGSNIGSELQPVIDSKSLAIANPKAVEYAKAMQDRLTNGGAIDAQTAQDVVQHFNDMLKSFYKNPSYDNATNVSIDALVANKFREALDKQISSATGTQYQALKNQYGALSSMEKDVTHRNIVWGRQNKVGFASNIANIASGAELVKGLIRMNPADIAVSGGIKLMQKYMKYLNNPDVGVSKIFSEIEKPSLPSIESKSVQATPKQVISSSPKYTSKIKKVK